MVKLRKARSRAQLRAMVAVALLLQIQTVKVLFRHSSAVRTDEPSSIILNESVLDMLQKQSAGATGGQKLRQKRTKVNVDEKDQKDILVSS